MKFNPEPNNPPIVRIPAPVKIVTDTIVDGESTKNLPDIHSVQALYKEIEELEKGNKNTK